MVWDLRDYCRQYPKAVSKFLRSVDWNDRIHVDEARTLLAHWTPLEDPVDALEVM